MHEAPFHTAQLSCIELQLSHISRRQNFRQVQLKQSADDKFKFDENSRKLSKRVNTVGKGEIACCEQFLVFPKSFQKARFLEASKGVNVWEWVNPFPDDEILGLLLKNI